MTSRRGRRCAPLRPDRQPSFVGAAICRVSCGEIHPAMPATRGPSRPPRCHAAITTSSHERREGLSGVPQRRPGLHLDPHRERRGAATEGLGRLSLWRPSAADNVAAVRFHAPRLGLTTECEARAGGSMALKLQILVTAVGAGILALVVWFAAASYAAERDPSAEATCKSDSDRQCVRVT